MDLIKQPPDLFALSLLVRRVWIALVHAVRQIPKPAFREEKKRSRKS